VCDLGDRHVIGLPVAEIAHVLDRPAGTVKSDISRGLRRLRELCPDPATSLTTQEVSR
jgi:DNA-directed RNA polymerase specialized sigma24 family protein